MSTASEKPPSRVDLYLAALPKQPPSKRPRSSSEGVASNVFYLMFGGATPPVRRNLAHDEVPLTAPVDLTALRWGIPPAHYGKLI
jgi:hypothetical protein